MFKKNISDGVGSLNESIDTRLYPPLFWLDNIFNNAPPSSWSSLGCALTFASEAKFEIEAKISFRLEAKKKPYFT